MTTTMEPRQDAGTDRDVACYVYGIVPADVEIDEEASGVGDPPGHVELVRRGTIAAMVSDVRVDRPLNRPQDLLAYEQLLDQTATEVPVIPLRYGAVLTDRQAVEEELLADHHDEFAQALSNLEHCAEFVVRGRYVEEAVLAEVLSEYPEAAQLREQIQGMPVDASREHRIQLGEFLYQAITAKREADTRRVLDALAPHCEHTVERMATHEEDAAHVAVLARTDRQQEIEKALAELAEEWSGRVDLRLLGPMAPYDFVPTGGTEG
jgi:hypothetical protein